MVFRLSPPSLWLGLVLYVLVDCGPGWLTGEVAEVVRIHTHRHRVSPGLSEALSFRVKSRNLFYRVPPDIYARGIAAVKSYVLPDTSTTFCKLPRQH